MKKLKKFWQENSVLLVLLMILIACLIAISVVVVTYFVGSSSSKYGDRLDGIKSHPFKDSEQSDIIGKYKDDETIKDAKIRISGKVIYVTINFTSNITLVEAESKVLASLEYFSEDIKSFYDIEFMIESEATEESEGFQIIGSHNVSGTGGIVWNNNRVVSKEE